LIVALLATVVALWFVLGQTHLGVESFLAELAFIGEHVGIVFGLDVLPHICDHLVFEVAADTTHIQSCHWLSQDVFFQVIRSLYFRVSRIQTIRRKSPESISYFNSFT